MVVEECIVNRAMEQKTYRMTKWLLRMEGMIDVEKVLYTIHLQGYFKGNEKFIW